MAGEWSKSGVREVCEAIAAQAIEGAVGQMFDMCGNAGQASIVSSGLAPSAADAFADISNGNTGISLDCNHPEAVSIIKEAGEDILNEAADRCATIRDAAQNHSGDETL